ncbi:hypothetical protein SAMN05216421_2891 [Halopseudomonas xinjiangensis]|uniref:Uncharacterized protein n=1 Tax=Halopseudomonas xinjiangensis TaxID=487184 RepID=A0A1H1XKF6_9GAMM|nr:hypothetical protein [Halopseudomonas xinjiangensis]SDT09737.1 hypothetical protein SAMN05216421_2891 [Halopseudomonas xinjiangensis]
MNFEHLYQNAQRAFEEARKHAESNPDVAERNMADGHQLMVAYYLANANDAYVSEVEKLLDVEFHRFSKHPDQAFTYRQNQYALLCLSAKDPMRAKKILSFPAKYKDAAALDVHLNVRLRRLVGDQDAFEQKTAKLTKSESDLIEAFDASLNRREVNWSAVATAWKSMKSKRFKFTVLEHRDLFTDTLKYV